MQCIFTSSKSKLHDKLITEVGKKLGKKYEINQLDGVKVEINENTWSLIRKSNTEDIIRISTESNDRHMLEQIQKEMIEAVRNCHEQIK